MVDRPAHFSDDDYYNFNTFDVEALRKQDAAEFERLYHVLAPSLRLYLMRLCGEAETASDLLQETFVKAYRALPRTRPDLQPRPWLYKIATNTAHSALRVTSWKRVLPFSDQLPKQPLTIATLLESQYAETELVEHALRAIKPEYASCLLLHWRSGFSLDELCDILAISRDNLKKRLYRAKKAFSTAYAHECAAAGEGGK